MDRSLVHVKLPTKISRLAIGSLAVGGGGLAGIPAAPTALLAGEWRWGVCMLTYGLGVVGVGAESTRAWGIGSGRRRFPRRCELRRGYSSGWTIREPGTSSGS
jgi:hypothetical protein